MNKETETQEEEVGFKREEVSTKEKVVEEDIKDPLKKQITGETWTQIVLEETYGINRLRIDRP